MRIFGKTVSLCVAIAVVGLLARPARAQSVAIQPWAGPHIVDSVNTFGGFVRCPAEGGACTNPFESISMCVPAAPTCSNPTAYFRDVLAGAYTYVAGATDGETWNATFTDPNGGENDFPGITFHANYQGYQNCF